MNGTFVIQRSLSEEDQDWYLQRGLIKNKVDVQKMVDLRFIQAAVPWVRTGDRQFGSEGRRLKKAIWSGDL